MAISDELVKMRDIIAHILQTQPETRDNDTLLLLRCWKYQGISMPGSMEDDVLEKGMKPESIRRIRQLYQASGRFIGIKRKEKLAEADKIREWAKGGSEHASEDEKEAEAVDGPQRAEGITRDAGIGAS